MMRRKGILFHRPVGLLPFHAQHQFQAVVLATFVLVPSAQFLIQVLVVSVLILVVSAPSLAQFHVVLTP